MKTIVNALHVAGLVISEEDSIAFIIDNYDVQMIHQQFHTTTTTTYSKFSDLEGRPILHWREEHSIDIYFQNLQYDMLGR